MKIFRADYKYCERSYLYSDKYIEWNFKEHKYYDKKYFNSLNINDVGIVIREFDDKNIKNRFVSYNAKIILKDEKNMIIIYKVSNINIYGGYKIFQNITRKEKLNKIKNGN